MIVLHSTLTLSKQKVNTYIERERERDPGISYDNEQQMKSSMEISDNQKDVDTYVRTMNILIKNV